jgi:beta-phosphoglucomutase-like phosphatase (HAD superfamily)
VTALVVDDSAFGDAEGAFAEATRYLSRRLSAVRPLDADALPGDRAAAIAALDLWAGDGARNWRLELVRWYEAHAPVTLGPDPRLNGLLRAARRDGVRIAVASPLPRAACELYLAQVGVRRLVGIVTAEEDGDPVAAARSALGAPDAPRIRTADALRDALTPSQG